MCVCGGGGGGGGGGGVCAMGDHTDRMLCSHRDVIMHIARKLYT